MIPPGSLRTGEMPFQGAGPGATTGPTFNSRKGSMEKGGVNDFNFQPYFQVGEGFFICIHPDVDRHKSAPVHQSPHFLFFLRDNYTSQTSPMFFSKHILQVVSDELSWSSNIRSRTDLGLSGSNICFVDLWSWAPS